MLRLWRHPKTKEARLYFTLPAIRSATKSVEGSWRYKDVKIWLQSSENGQSEINTVIKGNTSVPDDVLDKFQAAAMDAAGLDGEEAWDELVLAATEAEANEPKAVEEAEDESSSAGSEASNKARAAEAMKLDIALIKLDRVVTVEIDSTETKLIETLLRSHPKVRTRRADIGSADIRCQDDSGNELLIERKRCTGDGHKTDFEASLKAGGKLFDQSDRLSFIAQNSDHQIVPIMLLEGNVYANSGTLLLQQIDGALGVMAATQRVSVLMTYNANHSAYLMVKLIEHFLAGELAVPEAKRSKPKALFEQKRHVLESIPGVSEVIAENLLVAFGSVKGVAAATHEELAAVKGVGTKRAKDIARVLGAF